MQSKSLFRGVGIGLVAGALLTAAVIPVDKRRVSRSKAGRTLRTVGQVIEGVCDSLK
jgi:hypothetical protein